MGNKIWKALITTMILATFVLPQHTLWQWDVDVDEPASWIIAQKQQSSNGKLLWGRMSEQVERQKQVIQKMNSDVLENKDIKIIRSKTNGLLNSNPRNWIVAGILSNKIDPTSVASYAKGWGRWSILCSTIARINLNILTWLPYYQWWFSDVSIARGDAYALALHGSARWQMIITNKTSIESDIWAQYDQTHNTIFDIYFYKGSNGGVMQGHRAVIFIGTDDQIYILDPIRGQITSKPQLLSDHFEADWYYGYTIYIAKTSYQPKQQYKIIQEYYEIQDSASLVELVSDGAATVENTPLSDDTSLVINHPIKFTTKDQEVIIEKGAVITVEHTTNLVGWKLIAPQGKFQAQFTQSELSMMVGARDR